MFEALTTEALLSLITVAVSMMAMFGSFWALKSAQRKRQTIDITGAVQHAPYHRLHNITPRNQR